MLENSSICWYKLKFWFTNIFLAFRVEFNSAKNYFKESISEVSSSDDYEDGDENIDSDDTQNMDKMLPLASHRDFKVIKSNYIIFSIT